MWLALSEPGPDELEDVGASFHLPELAVEDARAGPPASQAGGLRRERGLVAKTTRCDQAQPQIEVGELDMFLGARYAIAISRSSAGPLARPRTPR